MRLRYRIVEMALDIEHHMKLQLLRKMMSMMKDGYQVVKDYIDSLDDRHKKNFFLRLIETKEVFTAEILLKSMKVIILFGHLLKLYRLEN